MLEKEEEKKEKSFLNQTYCSDALLIKITISFVILEKRPINTHSYLTRYFT